MTVLTHEDLTEAVSVLSSWEYKERTSGVVHKIGHPIAYTESKSIYMEDVLETLADLSAKVSALNKKVGLP